MRPSTDKLPSYLNITLAFSSKRFREQRKWATSSQWQLYSANKGRRGGGERDRALFFARFFNLFLTRFLVAQFVFCSCSFPSPASCADRNYGRTVIIGAISCWWSAYLLCRDVDLQLAIKREDARATKIIFAWSADGGVRFLCEFISQQSSNCWQRKETGRTIWTMNHLTTEIWQPNTNSINHKVSEPICNCKGFGS